MSGAVTGQENAERKIIPEISDFFKPKESPEKNDSAPQEAAQLSSNRSVTDIHKDGLVSHHILKTEWSTVLKWLLGGMICCQWILLTLVGFKVWDFSDYKWLLPTLLVQNFAQVVSLAFIVVQSLFKEMKN